MGSVSKILKSQDTDGLADIIPGQEHYAHNSLLNLLNSVVRDFMKKIC